MIIIKNSFNNFIFKVKTFCINYKLHILIGVGSISLFFGMIFLYKIIFIKTVIKGAIVATVVEQYAPTAKEDALKAIIQTADLIQDYGSSPTFNPIKIPKEILEKLCPTDSLKIWLEQYHPENLLKDNLGRDYYIITKEINKEYAITGPTLREFKITMLERLDPSGYNAYASSFAKAQANIDKNNLNIAKLQNLVAEENLKMNNYKNWLMTGCVIGLVVAYYCTKKSLEILVIAN